MDDQKLLKAAAKAAGIEIDMSPCNGGGWGNTGFDSLGNAVLDWHNGITWNPLTKDGDALWLAVKLSISVIHEEEFLAGRTIRTIEAIGPERADGSRHCEMHSLSDEGDFDSMAIVRGCIVRAAAAMAK